MRNNCKPRLEVMFFFSLLDVAFRLETKVSLLTRPDLFRLHVSVMAVVRCVHFIIGKTARGGGMREQEIPVVRLVVAAAVSR